MPSCQLKTPAKVSWAFKMVSQFGSLGYTIMGKMVDLTVVQKTIIDTLHKEWTEAGVKASRATTHRRVKDFGYSCLQRRLTWAKEKNWTVASGPKSSFQMRASFVFHLETKS